MTGLDDVLPPRPYPAAIYTGSTGEATATIRRASTPPEVVYPSGNSCEYLARGEDTGGHFGLLKWNFGGAPGQSEPHLHRTFSESFFLLSGSIQFFDGTSWSDAAPGDFVHVPPGGVHGYQNVSGAPASMLVLFTPGAPREAYFESLRAMAEGSLALTDDEKASFFIAHDNVFV
ncbi:cupin domain-containing protein [Nocardioides speluncae]|uniref:cupin domain-containing protein n=1 Tax=Nocardioides speluncae TaxID=2670337 RepID=UPI000D699D7B|nr:cupin domain-containing protein [Nocardioides speluncae]